MFSAEEMMHHQDRLLTYRQNLSYLLQQADQYGGEHAAPLQIINSIATSRDTIQQLKDILRTNGVKVDDKPDGNLSHPSCIRSSLSDSITYSK